VSCAPAHEAAMAIASRASTPHPICMCLVNVCLEKQRKIKSPRLIVTKFGFDFESEFDEIEVIGLSFFFFFFFDLFSE